MIDRQWHLEDTGSSDPSPAGAQQLLVSLHFLRTALRRGWIVWVALGAVGLVMGAVLPTLMPAPSNGTATLLLSHPSNADPSRAMDTDVSLATTRTVAHSVVRELHLEMSPEEFQGTVSVTPTTTTVLKLNVAAPDDTQAVSRVGTMADAFLTFRNDELQKQAKGQIAGYRDRITSLQKQVKGLTQHYNALSVTGASGQEQASNILDSRAQLGSQITSLQQQVEEVSLQTSAVIGASHVIDPAAVIPHSHLRRLVLDMGSGLIGGLGLGMGLVLFRALTSDKLRRREEVAIALGAPVRLSVGRLRELWYLAIWRRRKTNKQALEILARVIDNEVIDDRKRRTELVLGSVDSAEETVSIAAAVGARLARRGVRVFMVDLTEHGGLEEAGLAEQFPTSASTLANTFYRPEQVRTFTYGPKGSTGRMTGELAEGDRRRHAWDDADVVIVVAEIDLNLGVQHLPSWAERMVFVVTAGRSSAERMRAIGELTRKSSIEPQFVLLTGADSTDESVGLPDRAETPPLLQMRAQL